MMVTLTCNIGDNIIVRLGFEFSYGVVALVAFAITLLIFHRDLVLISVILFLSLAANMPAEFLLNFGVDRDLFAGMALAVVLAPSINWVIS